MLQHSFSLHTDLATDTDRRDPDATAPGTSGRIAPDAPSAWYEIVVGYDGSEPAKRALARAATLANERTRLIVVAITEPYPRSGVTIPANEDAAEIRRRRDDLDDARAILSQRGVRAELAQRRGTAADVLVEASRDADLVIVGSRKLSRLRRLLLGSVSAKIVHDAACDVLVVR
jgi:nucleotide-binding universal stress UspA family protein